MNKNDERLPNMSFTTKGFNFEVPNKPETTNENRKVNVSGTIKFGLQNKDIKKNKLDIFHDDEDSPTSPEVLLKKNLPNINAFYNRKISIKSKQENPIDVKESDGKKSRQKCDSYTDKIDKKIVKKVSDNPNKHKNVSKNNKYHTSDKDVSNDKKEIKIDSIDNHEKNKSNKSKYSFNENSKTVRQKDISPRKRQRYSSPNRSKNLIYSPDVKKKFIDRSYRKTDTPPKELKNYDLLNKKRYSSPILKKVEVPKRNSSPKHTENKYVNRDRHKTSNSRNQSPKSYSQSDFSSKIRNLSPNMKHRERSPRQERDRNSRSNSFNNFEYFEKSITNKTTPFEITRDSNGSNRDFNGNRSEKFNYRDEEKFIRPRTPDQIKSNTWFAKHKKNIDRFPTKLKENKLFYRRNLFNKKKRFKINNTFADRRRKEQPRNLKENHNRRSGEFENPMENESTREISERNDPFKDNNIQTDTRELKLSNQTTMNSVCDESDSKPSENDFRIIDKTHPDPIDNNYGTYSDIQQKLADESENRNTLYDSLSNERYNKTSQIKSFSKIKQHKMIRNYNLKTTSPTGSEISVKSDVFDSRQKQLKNIKHVSVGKVINVNDDVSRDVESDEEISENGNDSSGASSDKTASMRLDIAENSFSNVNINKENLRTYPLVHEIYEDDELKDIDPAMLASISDNRKRILNKKFTSIRNKNFFISFQQLIYEALKRKLPGVSYDTDTEQFHFDMKILPDCVVMEMERLVELYFRNDY